MMEETSTMRKTFCFSNGALCHLTDEQIEKIPYLSALVSAAEGISSIRNDLGFYKFDSRIQPSHFAFVLESFSFVGIREIFTHLPRSIDVLSIIDLYDFLGLATIDEPTFEEIDLTFFTTMIYKPSVEKYIEKIRVFQLQDMAVRFAVALARESYDETNPDVIDQIYWFVMFILSAYDYFGPRLRHHLYRIAEHYFSLFSPTHLEPLAKVMEQVNKGRITILDSLCEDFGFFEEEKTVVHQDDLVSYLERPLVVVVALPRQKKQEEWVFPSLRAYYQPRPRSYFNEYREWYSTTIDKHLRPVYTRVADTMYERLQYHINKYVIKYFRGDSDIVYRRWSVNQKLRSLFDDPLVKKDMDEEIVREIRKIMPMLRKRHEELVIQLRQYDLMHENPDDFENDQPLWLNFSLNSMFARCQEETLEFVCLFEQLDQKRPLEQLHSQITDRLQSAVEQQRRGWQKNHQMILKIKHPELNSHIFQYDSLETYFPSQPLYLFEEELFLRLPTFPRD